MCVCDPCMEAVWGDGFVEALPTMPCDRPIQTDCIRLRNKKLMPMNGDETTPLFIAVEDEQHSVVRAFI